METMTDPSPALVTGGTGLIGSHLLLALLQRGVRVRALRRKNSHIENVRKVFGYYTDEADALFERIEWVHGSLDEPKTLAPFLRDAGHVYHCAGMVSFNPGEEEAIKRANIRGTAHIVEGCLKAGVKKLCYVSSSSALGKPAEDGHIDESTPWEDAGDLSDYALSKYGAELEVWKGIERGLEAVIVNPTIVLGPGDWSRSSARLIQTIWKGFPFYSTGVNSFVDVRDVARAMVELTHSPIRSERFVITSENWPYRKLFHTIADHLGKRRPFIQVNRALGEIAWRSGALAARLTGKAPAITRATVAASRKRYYFSNEKIRHTLGFEFIPLEESIRDTCRLFLRDQKDS
jgi:nucleoside-diphosphate-sugar epimerase